MEKTLIGRRQLLKALPVAAAAVEAGRYALAQTLSQTVAGRFKQGITRQVFGQKATTEECCREAVKIGFKGFDFADSPEDWPILKKYGLVQSMYRVDAPGATPAPGGGPALNKPPGWDAIAWKEAQGVFLKACHDGIDTAATNGFPNFLLQAGPRGAGLSLDQGADNAVAFCNALKSHAEDKGVTLCMEILNSKQMQGGVVRTSMFDHTAWGVDVVKRVNSPRVKILYDIWQADIMEGDVAKTITDNFQYIAHFHTGGVPGRHQIDDSQELNYHYIAKVIADLGYTGFVSHEWSPTPGTDPIAAAKKVFEIMNA